LLYQSIPNFLQKEKPCSIKLKAQFKR